VTKIPLADPRRGFLAARDELRACFDRVLDGGNYILGEEVAAFEQEWAARCSTAHAVGVSSGTDALALALRAVGVEPGDEVLVPAMTAIPTWMAVTQIGAIPVGVDIEPRQRGMDPAKAAAAVGERTRAIVAVHLYGHPADVEGLLDVARGARLPLVEDAAQAHGAAVGQRPAGSIGDCAAFSFYPTKNLGAIGDAGAVTTSDDGLADRVRLLREYGWRVRGDSERKGVNARLDELQASFLRVMLRGLDGANARRAEVARAYGSGLAGLDQLTLPHAASDATVVWHLYVVNHPRRDELAALLASEGIGTAVHYRPAPHLTSAFRDDGGGPGSFPEAERHADTALSLPVHPGLTDEDVRRVVTAVRDACSTV
jgi:dTDP-3-amino-3,4,6-trideoxy-alpha-D-glucose transaminase